MSWVAQGSQRARDNSKQYNLKLNNVFLIMMVCMVPFMKHSISFSFNNVNRISIDIISLKEITRRRVYLRFVQKDQT